MATTTSEHLNVERRGAIFIIIMQKPPENRLTMKFAQQLIDTYRAVERELSSPKNASREGAVILKGDNAKFFSTV